MNLNFHSHREVWFQILLKQNEDFLVHEHDTILTYTILVEYQAIVEDNKNKEYTPLDCEFDQYFLKLPHFSFHFIRVSKIQQWYVYHLLINVL